MNEEQTERAVIALESMAKSLEAIRKEFTGYTEISEVSGFFGKRIEKSSYLGIRDLLEEMSDK